MRNRFLQALTQPIEDIKEAGRRLDRFNEPVIILKTIDAKAAKVERALETLSLGLTLAELLVPPGDDDDGGAP